MKTRSLRGGGVIGVDSWIQELRVTPSNALKYGVFSKWHKKTEKKTTGAISWVGKHLET